MPGMLAYAIPTGGSPTATVPLLNCWIVWWNSESLGGGLQAYWNAPLFFPTQGALALSEPQPLTLLLAPVVYAFGSPIPAYNLYVLFTLVLNGITAYHLLSSLKVSRGIAIAGGIGVVLHPLGLHNLEACQLLALWPMLWTTQRLLRLPAEPSASLGFQIGLGMFLMAATCLHHLLFYSLVMAVCVWSLLPWHQPWRRTLTCGLTFLVTSSLLVLPIVLPVSRVHAALGLERDPQVVGLLSAKLTNWLSCQASSLTPSLVQDGGEFALLPGLLRTALAVSILSFVFRRSTEPSQRRLLVFLGLVLLTSVALSLGTNLAFFSWSPWLALSDFIPTLASVRSPFRFAYISQLIIILLASMALSEVVLGLRRWQTRKTSGAAHPIARLGTGPVLLMGSILLGFEVPPVRTYVFQPPLAVQAEPWVEYLSRAVPPKTPLVCLPVAAAADERAMQQAALWMHYSTLHRQPLANGYSGFTPPAWRELRERLRAPSLDQETVDELRRQGIELIVARLRDAPQISGNLSVELIFDSQRYRIWRILDDD